MTKPPLRLEQTQEQPSARERLLDWCESTPYRKQTALLALEAAAESAEEYASRCDSASQKQGDYMFAKAVAANSVSDRIRALIAEIRGQR